MPLSREIIRRFTECRLLFDSLSSRNMATVGENRYGKEGIRVVRVRRSPYNGNTFDEWIVRVLLEGDFVGSYADGDNSKVLPTDTMKNTGTHPADVKTPLSWSEDRFSVLFGSTFPIHSDRRFRQRTDQLSSRASQSNLCGVCGYLSCRLVEYRHIEQCSSSDLLSFKPAVNCKPPK